MIVETGYDSIAMVYWNDIGIKLGIEKKSKINSDTRTITTELYLYSGKYGNNNDYYTSTVYIPQITAKFKSTKGLEENRVANGVNIGIVRGEQFFNRVLLFSYSYNYDDWGSITDCTITHSNFTIPSVTWSYWSINSTTLTPGFTLRMPKTPVVSSYTQNPDVGNNISVTANYGGVTDCSVTLFVNNNEIMSTGTQDAEPFDSRTNVLSLNSEKISNIYNILKNSVTGSVRIDVESICKYNFYDGNGIRTESRMGLKTSVVTNINVPASVVPTFTSVTAVETVSSVANIVGAFTESLSNLRLQINGASGSQGSTIVSYRMELNGIVYNTADSNTGLLNWSGTKTLTATITDSRSRTSTKTINITVLPYTKPTISEFKVERCNLDGSLNQLGTYVKVTRNGTIATINNKNQWTTVLYSRLRGSSNWGAAKVNFTNPIGSNIMNTTDILSTYAITSSYEFRIDFSDRFNMSTLYFNISTGQAVMSWGKTGVGIGKVHERGSLDVDGDTYIMGNLGYIPQQATGTATAIILNSIILADKYTISFIASADNNGNATTINSIPLYKLNTTIAPKIKKSQLVTAYYDMSRNCFFIKASASGNATADKVLAPYTISNEDDIDIVGTMVDRAGRNASLNTSRSGTEVRVIPPTGYYDGVDDYVYQNDANYLASNILSGITLFGLAGTAKKSVTGLRVAMDNPTVALTLNNGSTTVTCPTIYPEDATISWRATKIIAYAISGNKLYYVIANTAGWATYASTTTKVIMGGVYLDSASTLSTYASSTLVYPSLNAIPVYPNTTGLTYTMLFYE